MNVPTERFDEVAKQQEAEKAKQGVFTGGKVGKQQSAIAQQESGTGGSNPNHLDLLTTKRWTHQQNF